MRAFTYFSLARWACLPFTLLGSYLCWRWARELYGTPAGLLALALWSLSPNVIAWAATITPDLPETAAGLLATYCFWRWLREPAWDRAVLAGLALGLAELCKFTWVVLFGLWPLLSVGCRRRPGEGGQPERWWRGYGSVAAILLIGIYVINAGYGFEGTFRRLGDYRFLSGTLAGEDAVSAGGRGGNRFAGTWIGSLPVPVPKNYLSGIDLQKLDFERGKWSYLNGEWKHGGWWYYYLVALALKVPLGTWVLGGLAVWLSFFRRRHYSASWRDELVLVAPAVAVFVLVSSQTGFSRYLRYVLPCFPFVFIWISKVARCVELRDWKVAAVAGPALAWSVASSLWVYPHSMSYFNELAGGPKGGHRYLIDANIDWGQDLFYLRDWYRQHPEARPFYAAVHSFVGLEQFGIQAGVPPRGPALVNPDAPWAVRPDQVEGPQPGWYAMSVHRLHDRDGGYDYFLRYCQPVDMIGYSIYIYHITLAEANRLRTKLGLPLLKEQGN